VRLTPVPAGQGAGAPAAVTGQETTVRVETWEPTLRRVRLDAYPNQRVLALRENTNAGWQATAGGKKLKPIVVDGWQQGWLVPPGTQGDVVLRFAPDRPYAAALIAGAVLLGLLVIAALLPRRRRIPAPAVPPVPRGRHRFLLGVAGGLALLAVGGLAAAGIVLLIAAALVLRRALRPHVGDGDRRRMSEAGRLAALWLPPALLALGGWLTIRAGTHTAAAPQLAALAAVSVVWLSAFLSGNSRRRWASRWKGRSTT
jgi:arabinofuranan 3-O-arabinosyltransferase